MDGDKRGGGLGARLRDRGIASSKFGPPEVKAGFVHCVLTTELANGLAGPVLGVGCYQWALATTPGGIVLPIAATAPLLAIPIAWKLEGDRPTRRSLVGGVIAVAGCVALTLAR